MAPNQSYGKIASALKSIGIFGGMTERLKVHVLKTCLVQANVGSNPTPSAENCMIKCPDV